MIVRCEKRKVDNKFGFFKFGRTRGGGIKLLIVEIGRKLLLP